MTHWFTVILFDSDGVYADSTDEKFGEMADRLFEAGCDDGTFGMTQGVLQISFARDAPTLREAITSAIRDVQSGGCRVERVEHEADPVFDEINTQLAKGTVVT